MKEKISNLNDGVRVQESQLKHERDKMRRKEEEMDELQISEKQYRAKMHQFEGLYNDAQKKLRAAEKNRDFV